MGGDGFVDAVHAAGRGKGKPPKLRNAKNAPQGRTNRKPAGWLKFLRGSRKETVEN
jgi:hypothetical protein